MALEHTMRRCGIGDVVGDWGDLTSVCAGISIETHFHRIRKVGPKRGNRATYPSYLRDRRGPPQLSDPCRDHPKLSDFGVFKPTWLRFLILDLRHFLIRSWGLRAVEAPRY